MPQQRTIDAETNAEQFDELVDAVTGSSPGDVFNVRFDVTGTSSVYFQVLRLHKSRLMIYCRDVQGELVFGDVFDMVNEPVASTLSDAVGRAVADVLRYSEVRE